MAVIPRGGQECESPKGDSQLRFSENAKVRPEKPSSVKGMDTDMSGGLVWAQSRVGELGSPACRTLGRGHSESWGHWDPYNRQWHGLLCPYSASCLFHPIKPPHLGPR